MNTLHENHENSDTLENSRSAGTWVLPKLLPNAVWAMKMQLSKASRSYSRPHTVIDPFAREFERRVCTGHMHVECVGMKATGPSAPAGPTMTSTQ